MTWSAEKSECGLYWKFGVWNSKIYKIKTSLHGINTRWDTSNEKKTSEFESIAIETTKENRRKGIKNENSISYLQDTFK